MTNNDRIENTENAEVSRLYRETATERAPAHLDNRVLKSAAKNRPSRYALSARWMRPMAWAATIGLCVAIALDVAVLPEGTDFASDVEPAMAAPEPLELRESTQPGATTESLNRASDRQPAPAANAPKLKLESDGPAPEAFIDEPADTRLDRNQGRAEAQTMAGDANSMAEPARRQVVEPASPALGAAAVREAEASSVLDESRTTETVSLPEMERTDGMADPGGAELALESAAADSEAFSSSLRKAAEEEAHTAAPMLLSAPRQSDSSCRHCSRDDVATPEKWLACIEALDAEGRDEDAAEERRLFETAYPNYAVD